MFFRAVQDGAKFAGDLKSRHEPNKASGLCERMVIRMNLLLTPAVSGHEDLLAKQIIEKIKNHCEYKTDAMGNIIAFKKGRKIAKNKVMLDAHMDEVGFIITGANENGFLTFAKVGGITDKVLFGKSVRIGDVHGVISGCPVHLLSEDAKMKVCKAEELYIDIGVDSKDEAMKLAKIGTPVIFNTNKEELGNLTAARALDDRIGCSVLIDMIKTEQEYDKYFTFTMQEELGCRGAQTAAYAVEPDYALVIEATTAADVADVPDDKKVCALGKGAVVSFMDTSAVYDREMYDGILETAEENNISVQIKAAVAGGNNSKTIHLSKTGIRTATIAAPTRYLHSQYCVADENDVKALLKLAIIFTDKLAAGNLG